ncbi:hypothetical protein [Streptomyces sp. AK02-01A]|uniref:hypothetical protein n=1 Tax=Streptomyces sp. AK02-01A TaxID=3028648 RepID=UPI0029AF2847|nr:hypothetical protein [Streptomyces sp. AK02-01A]MDX3855769.1 hypothetical protein [Streptomyces sp. AK02-01A]
MRLAPHDPAGAGHPSMSRAGGASAEPRTVAGGPATATFPVVPDGAVGGLPLPKED